VCVSSCDFLTQTHSNDRNCSLFNVKMELVKDGETQEVTTCRIQQDVSEWLVDEFMLLMLSSSIRICCVTFYCMFKVTFYCISIE